MHRIPAWRRWLSHLWEQHLESTSSEYNPQLTVSLIQGRLQLTAQDAIYSFGDYYLNFRRVFHNLDFSCLPARASVLVLGLGLGSIPQMLEEVFGRQYHYTAVEIDPVIVQLAQEYSLPRLQSPLQVITADARHFLQVDEQQYDLICMDVFQDAVVPEQMGTTEFLALLRNRLAPNGVLIYNRLANTNKRRRESRAFFDDFFRPCFPEGDIVNTGGNYMLINRVSCLLEYSPGDNRAT